MGGEGSAEGCAGEGSRERERERERERGGSREIEGETYKRKRTNPFRKLFHGEHIAEKVESWRSG